MRSHKLKGFTIIELLISLAIVVLLATITIFELRTASRGDELRTASRQVAADIRAMQSRALAAKNIKTCDTGTELAVCEMSETVCGGNSCDDDIPSAYGVHFITGTSTYSMFADINPQAALDYHYTGANEVFQTRTILPLGSANVILDQIMSGTSTVVTSVDVSFMRQAGSVRFYDSTTPPEPALVTVRLRHLISNETIEIEVNRITGRISIL